MLFAYGTLQTPVVFHAVTGLDRVGEPATLTGYRCRRLRGRSFPGVVPDETEHTVGLLYRDVHSFARLDDFEDDFYERVRAEVITASGLEDAFVYVVRREFHQLLSDELWNLEAFVHQDLERFLLARQV